MPDPYALTGKVAVVTGAASGIGRASAVRLAWAGADVVAADLDESGLAETKAEGERRGRTVLTAKVDVSVAAEVEGLVAHAVEAFGRLDVVANIAGIMRDAKIADLTEADLDEVLAVNVKGVFFGTRAAIRTMRDLGNGGSIVNAASSAVDFPAPGIGAYSMSKAAVVQLTRNAAMEVGKHGIRVNAVAPGYVDTAMTRRRFVGEDGTVDEEAAAGYLEMMRSMSALRMTGEPDDIAHTVVFLASDAARFMTGQILRPNGGTTMPW